jgi:16S rRNA (cytidine1402-2'-O)-methyltransferase
MSDNPPSSGKLYLVPTPIGNLEDISLRALRILRECDLLLAEDTRQTYILLQKYDIKKPIQSHHAHNEHYTVQKIVQSIKNEQKVIALVSDAGTPAISDPGFLLVRECVKQAVTVECLPGATAFVPALVQSGLPCDRFLFEGFLPHKKGRQTRLQALAQMPYTFILYESPQRLLKTLEQLAEVLGNERPAAVVREISKLHEETARGTLQELITHFTNKTTIKGEIVIVVAGNNE